MAHFPHLFINYINIFPLPYCITIIILLVCSYFNEIEENKMYRIIRTKIADREKQVKAYIVMTACNTKEEAEQTIAKKASLKDLVKYDFTIQFKGE